MKFVLTAVTLTSMLVVRAAQSATPVDINPGANFGIARAESAISPTEIVVWDRYLLPALPESVVNQLPETEAVGDRYRAERMVVANLVIGERILVAEDRAATYADMLPGFAAVLDADGFSQAADGTWFYDRYRLWMRFPLHRFSIVPAPHIGSA